MDRTLATTALETRLMAANIVVDGLVLNYSRPILASSSSTVTPTVRYSPGRARTDDEGRGIQRVSLGDLIFAVYQLAKCYLSLECEN